MDFRCPNCGSTDGVFNEKISRYECAQCGLGLSVISAIDVHQHADLLYERFQAAEFIQLSQVVVAENVLEKVPERTAREHLVLPLEFVGEGLKIAVREDVSSEELEKLRFVLNTALYFAITDEESLRAAIQRHYGQ